MEKNKTISPNQTAQKKHVVKSIIRHKWWIGGYVLLMLLCLAFYFLFNLHWFGLLGNKRILLQRLSLACTFAFLILMIAKLVEMMVIKQSRPHFTHYNFIRFIRMLSGLLIVLVIISFLFENWYTVAVSLGLISLIVGFALQTPISSFIGWLYIIFRIPYRIGDRIQVDTFTGDVMEINYLDTTLWEFKGEYLSNDLPTGRIIHFPNSLVLQSAVFNYSWNESPYIWNEISFQIAYESDLLYVESILKKVAANELGPDIMKNIERIKSVIGQTPVGGQQIKEAPFVNFRINSNTWVEALVIYLVDSKKAGAVRSSIIKKGISALLAQPEKVMFPKGNSR